MIYKLVPGNRYPPRGSVATDDVPRRAVGAPILRASRDKPKHAHFTLLELQSRFGDELLVIRVFCPHMWECSAKRV